MLIYCKLKGNYLVEKFIYSPNTKNEHFQQKPHKNIAFRRI
jgi:hypothetical protein